MSAYVLGPDADLDLNDIWENIAVDSVDTADRWVDKLFNAFEALARTPGMGHRREDLTQYSVLFWPVGAYLIIYSSEQLPIQIVRSRKDLVIFPRSCGGDCGRLKPGIIGARRSTSAPLRECRRPAS